MIEGEGVCEREVEGEDVTSVFSRQQHSLVLSSIVHNLLLVGFLDRNGQHRYILVNFVKLDDDRILNTQVKLDLQLKSNPIHT